MANCYSSDDWQLENQYRKYCQVNGRAEIHVPPDQFACDDCLAEMSIASKNRYRYPFINCTQCGPRYTIIQSMPYDRPNTTMAEFPLCAKCKAEYDDPLDRRFHALPLAFPECGPELRYVRGDERVSGNEAALACCIADLNNGDIVAVRESAAIICYAMLARMKQCRGYGKESISSRRNS